MADQTLQATIALEREEREIRTLLANLYDLQDVETWLNSPQPLLESKVPQDMIWEGYGFKVKQMLTAILDGAYL
jgi:hypothetical protein